MKAFLKTSFREGKILAKESIVDHRLTDCVTRSWPSHLFKGGESITSKFPTNTGLTRYMKLKNPPHSPTVS